MKVENLWIHCHKNIFIKKRLRNLFENSFVSKQWNIMICSFFLPSKLSGMIIIIRICLFFFGWRASLLLERWKNVLISFPASLMAQEWTCDLGSPIRCTRTGFKCQRQIGSRTGDGGSDGAEATEQVSVIILQTILWYSLVLPSLVLLPT